MKRSALLLFDTAVLVVCLAFVVRTQPAPSTQPATKAQTWEYKTIAAPVEPVELSIHGGAGWELVTVATVPTENGAKTLYFFKRPK
jgi:hypothetical protein